MTKRATVSRLLRPDPLRALLGDLEHERAELGVRRIVVERVDPGLERAQQFVVVQFAVGDADDAAAEGNPHLLALAPVLHDAGARAVAGGRVFQGGEQDLQGDVAAEDRHQIVQNDHLVGMLGNQLEQPDGRQVAALVGVEFLDFLFQDGPHGVRLGRSRPAEEIQSRRILPGHAAHVVAHDALAAVQFGQQRVRGRSMMCSRVSGWSKVILHWPQPLLLPRCGRFVVPDLLLGDFVELRVRVPGFLVAEQRADNLQRPTGNRVAEIMVQAVVHGSPFRCVFPGPGWLRLLFRRSRRLFPQLLEC